jgi:hypothetical protein
VAKVWRVSQAIGDIAFAYPYSLILLEIQVRPSQLAPRPSRIQKLNFHCFTCVTMLQDTLKSPPAENKTMKKASIISIMVTTFFYLCCGCFGYAAFGSDAPGNLLTGFGFYEPYWLIDFANACIILHLLGGYQVLTKNYKLLQAEMVTDCITQNRTITCSEKRNKCRCTASRSTSSRTGTSRSGTLGAGS